MSISTLTLGWREWLSLPDIQIESIKAKVDTGARSSCLHTPHYEIFQKDQHDWVRFTVHPRPKNHEVLTKVEAPVIDYRLVRDSGGHEENRPFIRTRLQIPGHHWEIELSLSNRENMKFDMLLGRTAINHGNILINPGKSYLTKNI